MPRLHGRHLESNKTKALNTLSESPVRLWRFLILQECADGIAGEFPQVPSISEDALGAAKTVIRNKRGKESDLI
jgi:hypothetical protein